MAKPVTKYSVRVENPFEIKRELEKAFQIATSNNPGPVLIDLPADVQRADIDIASCPTYEINNKSFAQNEKIIEDINEMIRKSARPCFLVGHGVKLSGAVEQMKSLIYKLNIPTVFSMPAFDTMTYADELNFGFIGTNGKRYANFVVGKSDLVISIGSRLDIKQVGNERSKFARQAQIIRIDIDQGNLSYKIHEDEVQYCTDIKSLLEKWDESYNPRVSSEWIDVCKQIKHELEGFDDDPYTTLLYEIFEMLPPNVIITTDVGQSDVWLAQQLRVKEKQSVHMSAGHGAMGFSLPAAIGAYYGSRRPVYSFSGDGGIQMNIQELQFIVREKLPIAIFVINNYSLGMIRQFQEANFNSNFSQTTEKTGYTVPSFEKIASAYGIEYVRIETPNDIVRHKEPVTRPTLFEIVIQEKTILKPNFGKNGVIQDQIPYLDRQKYQELMEL